MILTRLSLLDFRSFARSEIVFDQRQNYIFGRNWQGKSSIVDAIGFALLGTDVFPRRVAGASIRKEHLIRDGADSAKVELSFQIGTESYTLTRTLPRNQVVLRSGTRQIASADRTVKEKLLELADMEVDLFRNVFYAGQDELRRFLDFAPADRRERLENLTGAEEWRDRSEFLRTTRNRLDDLIQQLKSGKLGLLFDEMDELRASIEEKEQKLLEYEHALHRHRSEASSYDASLQKQQDAASQFGDGRYQESALRTERALGQGILEGLSRGKCPTCLQALTPRLQKQRTDVWRRKILQLDRKLATLSARLKGLEQAYHAFREGMSDDPGRSAARYEGQIQELQPQLADDRKRLKKLEQQSRSHGKEIEQIAALDAEVAFLHRLEDVVEAHRSGMRQRLISQLQTSMNDFLIRFHDGDNDMRLSMNADGDIRVVLHDREVPIFNLSGAMKDIFALAMRYGLLRIAARNVNFIVLDEPTRHMDPDNCDRLKEIFDHLLDHQLIVVTINDVLSDARGKHFAVSKDDSLASRIEEL